MAARTEIRLPRGPRCHGRDNPPNGDNRTSLKTSYGAPGRAYWQSSPSSRARRWALRRAVREDWPTTPEQRRRLSDGLDRVLRDAQRGSGRGPQHRIILAAVEVVVEMVGADKHAEAAALDALAGTAR